METSESTLDIMVEALRAIKDAATITAPIESPYNRLAGIAEEASQALAVLGGDDSQ